MPFKKDLLVAKGPFKYVGHLALAPTLPLFSEAAYCEGASKPSVCPVPP